MENTNEGLKREISVWGLSANITNSIVGAGIFVLPAIVAQGLGAASILAYLFCGVLIALIMLCFAEVGSKITSTGGAYTFIEIAFGKYAGFLAAIFIVSASITADAAVANALANVTGTMVPLFKEVWFKVLAFFIMFSGFAYINIIGVKQGIGLVKLTTVTKLIPLILLIVLGWKNLSAPNLYWENTPSLTSFGEMSLILFFAFKGGDTGLSVGGEVKNPQKTIPRAILISITGVLLLYVLIQTVAQGVLGSSLPSFKESPLAELAKVILGPWGFTLVTIGAAISMFGNISGDALSVPRVLYGAARDRVIPSDFLARVHKRFATPYVSIAVFAGLGFIFASIGGFKQLAIISGTSTLLIYIGVALSVIRLRKKIATENTFRIPGGNLVPLLSIVVIVGLLWGLSKDEMLGVAGFILIISLLYLLIKVLEKKN